MDVAHGAHPFETQWRRARVLAAWLDDDLAAIAVGATAASAELVARAPAARQALERRDELASNADAIRSLAGALSARASSITELDGSPADVRMVELARLVAMQPYVFMDRSITLPEGLARDAALFELAVPTTGTTELAVGFDGRARQFIVASRDQNLQVLGEYSGPMPDTPPGTIGVGFLVAAPPSWMRVALVGDRAVLVDGHHRAVALLAAGVGVVPAVVTELSSLAAVWSEGMLDASTCLGRKPALLSDYLDDEVSVSATLPYVGRAVTVTATELDLAPS